MNNNLDERTLQRCVDGELSESEQQALLRQLEASPAGWREVALSFLEHQLWSKAGHDFVHEPAPPLVAGPAQLSEAPLRPWSSRVRSVALAASTLLAVGLGYVGGQGRFGSNSAATPSGPGVVQSASNTSRPSGSPTAMVSMRNDSSAVPLRPDSIPAVTNSQPPSAPVFDAELLQQYGDRLMPRLSVEDRQRLEDQGYQIREEPSYYTVPIDDNRRLIVPVNTVRVRQQLQ